MFQPVGTAFTGLIIVAPVEGRCFSQAVMSFTRKVASVAREGEQEKLARQDAPALGLYVVTLRYQATSTG